MSRATGYLQPVIEETIGHSDGAVKTFRRECAQAGMHM